MSNRARVVDDAGKGRETLRTLTANVSLQNGTQRVVIGQVPADITVTRILVGSQVATAITSIDVAALAPSAALDASITGLNLMTQMTALDTGKTNQSQVLNTAKSLKVVADSPIIAVVIAGTTAPLSPVTIQVEYDVIGRSYGAYDAGGSSGSTY